MAITQGDEYRVQVARDLGAALRHFRTQRNVTQAEAAEMEKVGQPYLSKLESGSFGSSLNHALRLLRLLGCEVVVRRRVGGG
jgi:transcriptional regulator with XRE-family HTH domain